MLTGLHGIDIITPGTSTVGYVQDFDTDSFGRFQFALNTASINAFYVWIAFPPNARFRIDMSWLTLLHSARRRLPDSVIMKELVLQRQLRSGYTIRLQKYENLLRKDKKYKYYNTNLRLFKHICFNISEILYKQMLFLCNFCMLRDQYT